MTSSVSILIATRNRAQSLEATLASFAGLELPANVDLELIAIDNGSTDTTARVLSEACLGFPIRSTRIDRPGKSRCLNHAASLASGDVFLFTDDDVRPDACWIREMTRPLLEGVADAAQGGIRLADYLLKPWLTPMQRAWIAERSISETAISEVGTLTGANMGITRSAFERLGGFDDNLGPGALGLSEESLMALQLNDGGYRTIYVKDAEVEHHCSVDRVSRRGLLQSAAAIGRSLGYIYHHWLHMPVKLPGLRALKHLGELWTARVLHPATCWSSIPRDWELNLLREVCLWKQYAIEVQRPPNYGGAWSKKLAGRLPAAAQAGFETPL